MMDLPFQVEEWRPVKDFEGLYEVSNQGRVKSVCRVVPYAGHPTITQKTINEKILFITINRQKNRDHIRCLVKLYKRNTLYTKNVARLVAEAFIPNPDGWDCVLHLDDDATNNIPSNLQWGDTAENIRQAVERNRYRFGSNHHASKLSDQQRLDAWHMLKHGKSVKQVAKFFGVRHQVISDLNLGKIKGFSACRTSRPKTVHPSLG